MRLAELFGDGEWQTQRTWLRTRRDRNPFINANILLILARCGEAAAPFAPQAREARARFADYLDGHRCYHWPLVRGVSRMTDAPLASRLPWMAISPDADCTSLVHLALGDMAPPARDAVLEELAFYRADGERFRLPGFQRTLPGAAGSYLTWFPPRERCRRGTIETVDLGASANILWFLAEQRRLDAPGAAQTAEFVVQSVRRDLVLAEPFRVSLYYPRPAVLLYLVSRAAVWGRIESLLALRDDVLALLRRCPAPTALDALCRAAAAKLWRSGEPYPVPPPDGRGAFYVAPLLAWPLQRCAPLLPAAALGATQWDFRSEALEWALWLWLTAGEPG